MKTNHTTSDLDTQLSATLERQPIVHVPANFAARVAASAVAQPIRPPRQARSYGRAAALASAALLLFAMFALAPITQPAFTSIAFDLELVAAAQLIGIAYWLTAWRRAF